MKKATKLLFGLPIVLLTLSGCSQDELVGDFQPAGANTISATMEGETKTRLAFATDSYKLSWSENDAFKLLDDAGKSAKFVLASTSAEGATGNFSSGETGNLTGTVKGAAFPADAAKSLSGNTLTMELTSPITFSTQVCNLPMYAKATEEGDYSSLTFKHLVGGVKISLSAIPAGTSQVIITADKPIWGAFTADISTTDPVLVPATDNTSTSLTVNIADVNDKVLYIPLPAYAEPYGSIKVELSDGTTKNFLTEWTNKTVARATFYSASLEYKSSAATTPTGIEDALGTATAGAKQLELSEQVTTTTDDATIEVPNTQGSSVVLDFTKTPNTSAAPMVLQAGTTPNGASTASISQLTVALPAPESDTDKNARYEVDANDATVNIVSTSTDTSNPTVISELTSNSGIGTLIIGSNVQVGTLTIKGGTVVIEKGGLVSKVKRETSLTSAFIFDNNDNQTWTLGDQETNIFAAESAEAAALRYVAANGVTKYTLKGNVLLEKPLVISGTLELNLGGYNIKPANDALTALNDVASTDALIIVRRNGSLTIDGSGTIDTGNKPALFCAVKLTDGNDETDSAIKDKVATLIVNETEGTPELKGFFFAISGNGNRHNTSITINGGKFSAYNDGKTVYKSGSTTEYDTNNSAIYHPQVGTLEINGGYLEGKNSAIEMRSGTLTLKAGELKATGTAEIPAEPFGNGATITGAAVAISQHTTNKDLKLIVPSGSTTTMTGNYALYEEDCQDETITGISMDVQGGKFYGKIYSENFATFITKGTFNHPTALNYLDDNADVDVKFDADASLEAPGFVAESGMQIRIDLNGGTFTLKDPNVGSEGTQTNGCQLKAGSTVSFSNGTLTAVANTKHLIQNYCDLTLTNMTLTPPSTMALTLSNCAGDITIDNTTISASESGVAFDAYYWPKNSYTDGVQVTVKNDSKINGKVEFSGDGSTASEKHSLTIESGTFTGEFSVADGTYTGSNIQIKSGTFSDPRALNYVIAGKEGDKVTIDMNSNITIAQQISLKAGSAILDMNGYTIDNTTAIWDDADAWSLISVQGGTLDINGGGKLDALKDDCYALDVRNGATLNVNENTEVIGNVSAVYVEKGMANIKNGTYKLKQLVTKFNTEQRRYMLNCLDANYKADTANIEVTGGSFYGYNPSQSDSENPQANYVFEGYEAAKTSTGTDPNNESVDVYTVTAE